MQNKKVGEINLFSSRARIWNNHRLGVLLVCSFLFILFFTTTVSAALNVSLSNQGSEVRLKSTGELLTSGNLTVTLWDSLTGGNLVYNETFLNSIVNGSWGVMLGENSSNPLPLEFGRIYYFDYEIDGSDVNFTIFNGTSVGRQFFYSPLGDINTSDIVDDSITSAKIFNNTIIDADISDSTNLTLGQQITFAFGEIIDNIVDGFIRITGGLNVTGNIDTSGNVTADYFFGNGSQLTNLPEGILGTSINTTEIEDGTIIAADIGANAVNGTQIIENVNLRGNVSISELLTVLGDINFTGLIYGNGSQLTDITGLVDSQISDLLTINASGSVTWSALTSYPSACLTSQTITTIGDTLVCSEISITESQISDLKTYIENNTSGWTANFTNIYSLDWTNVTLTESQISDLTHTTDTNETTRFDDLTSFDCPAGQLVIGVQANGTVLCVTDADSGNSNIFDQVLNTTSNVTFFNVTAQNFLGTINASDVDNNPWLEDSQESNLNVNRSNFWDGLNTPSDINAADITDDNTYLQVVGDTGTGNFIFNQNLTVDTDTLFVDSTNNRVGIGTTSPGRQLHLDTTDTNGPDIFFSDADTGSVAGSDGLQLGMDAGEHGFFWNYEINGDIYFGANNTEVMRIDGATHNVGIGTSSPGKLLHLDTTSTNGPDIFFTDADTGSIVDSDGLQLGMDAGEHGFFWNYESAGDIYFGAGNAEVMRLASSGNVGIGITSPSAKLEVANGNFLVNDTVFFVNGTSGRVGIGTTSPTQKLDVQGSVNITGVYYGNGSGLTDIGADSLNPSSINTTHIVDGTITDSDISDTTNLTLGEKIVFVLGGFIQNIISGQIDVNGTLNVTNNLIVGSNLTVDTNTLFVNSENNRVGIGTTTPTQKLDINGSVKVADTYIFSDGATQTIPGDPNPNSWFLSSASLKQSFNVSSIESSLTGMFFKPDGLRMYVVGFANDNVTQYHLSTAWDISTAVINQSFNVGTEESNAFGLFFRQDGKKMYIVGNGGQEVNEYDLSTAWDVSTASHKQFFSVSAENTNPAGQINFRPDGLKMYVTGNLATEDELLEYTLSTAWDISTASFTQQFNLTNNPTGTFFKPDGTRMYSIGTEGGQTIIEYILSTPWDISTSTSSGETFSISSQETQPAAIFFKPDGTKMYISGSVSDHVHEYDLGFIISEGNVGIGTTSPTQKLDVNGSVNVTGGVSINSGLNVSGAVSITPAAPSMAGGVTDATYLNGVRGIVISGNHLYSVGVAGTFPFSVFDITDTENPERVGSITGSLFQPGHLDVYGDYAVVSEDVNLTIIDVSNPRSPVEVGTIAGNPGVVRISGKYVYVTTSGSIFQIYDISDPTAPVEVGSVSDAGLSSSSGFDIEGNYAYIAARNTDSLQVVDISDPTNPVIVGNLTDSVNMDEAFDVNVVGRYAYVTARASDSFAIVDVIDPTAPVLVGSVIDTVNLTDPRRVAIVGDYAYISNYAGSVQVYDVSNKSSPVKVSDLVDATNLNGAYYVIPYGRHIYVSAQVSNRLNVIDIKGLDVSSSNIGSLSAGEIYVIGDGNVGNDLHVGGSLSVGPKGITSQGPVIFDNNTLSTDNGTVNVAGNLNVTGTSYLGDVILTSDNITVNNILSRDGNVTFYNSTGSEKVRITNEGKIGIGTTSPEEKLTLQGGSFLQRGGTNTSTYTPTVVGTLSLGPGPIAIKISGTYAYIIDSSLDDFKVINIVDPSAPALVSNISLGTTPEDLRVVGRYAYVVDSGSDDLKVIDISNPANLSIVGTLGLGPVPRDLDVSGSYVYITDDNTDDLKVIDVSNPKNPFLVNNITISAAPLDIVVSGRYAYIADNTLDILKIVDVLDPTSMSIVGNLSGTSFVGGFDVSGSYVYFADDVAELKVVDVSNVSNPVQVGAVSLGSIPTDLEVSGGYAYVTDEATTDLRIIDVLDPTAPVTIATLSTPSSPQSVDISGRYLYMVDTGTDDLKILDISGIDVQSAIIHSLEAGSANVLEDLQVGKSLSVQTGLNVGANALISGILSVSGIENATSFVVASGNVGIGTTSPAVKLHVNISTNGTVLRLQDVDGTCNQNPEAGSLTISCSSDEKLKENIREAESALEEFEDIKIKDYVVKASGKETTGVIAQEINETHPELVHEEDGELFVEQPNPWKLLKAIQELKEMIESLIGGNYSFGSTGMVVDEDSVGQAVVLLNSTEVNISFTEEYEVVPVVTVTPREFIDGQYRVTGETTKGFVIELQKVQDIDIGFNWHAFARPVEEIGVNLTNITEVNITNGTVLGNESLNVTISNETIEINNTITNETIEDINETADEGNETVEPIKEIPESNETIDENNKSEEEINQTVVINETENIEIGKNLTNSNESVEEASVQQEGPQDPIWGSLITGGIIGINEKQGGEQGILSGLFRSILDLIGDKR